MEYSDQTVDDFLGNNSVKSKLASDLTEKMTAKRLENRKPPVKKVKLEKSGKRGPRNTTTAAGGPVKVGDVPLKKATKKIVSDDDDDDDDYESYESEDE